MAQPSGARLHRVRPCHRWLPYVARDQNPGHGWSGSAKHHENSCQSQGWFHLPCYFFSHGFFSTHHLPPQQKQQKKNQKVQQTANQNLGGNVKLTTNSLGFCLQHPSQLAQWWQVIGCGRQGQRVCCRLKIPVFGDRENPSHIWYKYIYIYTTP